MDVVREYYAEGNKDRVQVFRGGGAHGARCFLEQKRIIFMDFIHMNMLIKIEIF